MEKTTKTPDEIKKGLECCADGNNCSYECPYREDCLFGDSRALERDTLAIIQQLEAQVPRWNSMEKRAPDKNGKYLVHAHHWVEGVKPIIRCSLWLNGKWDKYDAYTVDHWMPLPEPPKEE